MKPQVHGVARWLAAGAFATLLVACAAPQLTPNQVSQLAYEALGPEMKMGEQLLTAWVPAATEAEASAAAPALSPEARAALLAASSPTIPNLTAAMALGAREPVNLAVGGPDSALTAQVLLRALRALPIEVPLLRIAFVGLRADLPEIAAAARLKRATLHFEQAPQ